MEALRSQLAETQGALTDKILQVRQLRADHAAALNTWTQQKQNFEAKLQQLEDEIRRLRQTNEVSEGGGKLLCNKGNGQRAKKVSLASLLGDDDELVGDNPVAREGDDETVVITRSQMKDIESKFENITNKLAEKTKLCESLQQQLLHVRRGSFGAADARDITDDQITKRWENLRNKIRTLSLDRFNETIQPKLVPDKSKVEFEHLSKHWKTYMTNGDLTCYIFRALIWRYLYTCLLSKYCRVWGKEYGDVATKLGRLFVTKMPDAEFELWRIHTAQLLNKACDPDPAVVSDVTKKILEATTLFATGIDTETLTKSLTEIVTSAAEISTILARSRYLALMADKPGSDRTRGFAYQAATMDVRSHLGTKTIVDMMISPCLLKKEADYVVLVKADVIC
ncbi:hypothetical protein F4813DRAFT_232711 [Daldinia decipiens]|uniref:uncharacterized protein n=1 Tax=Daldinia decipiens TaxID=326647 RepID=UPI0020C41132|nr:uncharacterized protein F4813DRAFT_232711 [Daldinia decipiens]KAI1654052.1 hypothetical protein F4813DRAFT_232711 [Daldinia decipiens]